jgi:hypothetical protein
MNCAPASRPCGSIQAWLDNPNQLRANKRALIGSHFALVRPDVTDDALKGHFGIGMTGEPIGQEESWHCRRLNAQTTAGFECVVFQKAFFSTRSLPLQASNSECYGWSRQIGSSTLSCTARGIESPINSRCQNPVSCREASLNRPKFLE